MSLELFENRTIEAQEEHQFVFGLSKSQLDTFLEIYKNNRVYMDRLPYTRRISKIATEVSTKIKIPIWPQNVFTGLVALRKKEKTGHLVKGLVKRKRHPKPEWLDSQIGLVHELYSKVQEDCASDRLPYTVEFDTIYMRFLFGSSLNVSQLQFYRAIMFLRKASKDSTTGRVKDFLEDRPSRRKCKGLFQ